MRLPLLALAATAAALWTLPAASAATLAPVAGEVIVGFKPGADTLRRHPMAERLAAARRSACCSSGPRAWARGSAAR